jgi:phage-related protein
MLPFRPLRFLGSSLVDLRAFPDLPRQEAGHQLFQVQRGDEPDDWRPMRIVGPGVREIRLHHEGQYRVFYVVNFRDGIYVLHAFQKKTQKTRKLDIEIARRRLHQIQEK